MAYWWVNQGKTARASAGYLWAPKVRDGDVRVSHWLPMEQLAPGDVVFNYANGLVFAVSRVRDVAQPHARPSAWPRVEKLWADAGLIVHLDQEMLEVPVAIAKLRSSGAVRPSEGPFDKNGDVKQGYLYAVSETAGDRLWLLLDEARGPDRLVARGEDTTPDMPDVRQGYFAGTVDRLVEAPQRGEQAQLRRYLLGTASEGTCDLCGRELPSILLRAAHIVRRADLTEDERRRFDEIAFRACALGCDALFEAGYIALENGITVSARPLFDDSLREAVATLVGRPSTAYDSKRAPFFERHAAGARQLT